MGGERRSEGMVGSSASTSQASRSPSSSREPVESFRLGLWYWRYFESPSALWGLWLSEEASGVKGVGVLVCCCDVVLGFPVGKSPFS